MVGETEQRSFIEDLHEDIVLLILNKLFTREAAMTCVLSKSWRTRWVKTISLRLDDSFLKEVIDVKPENSRRLEFLKIVTNIMSFHFLNLKEFRLKLPTYLDLEQNIEVDNWLQQISISSKKSLEIFDFDNDNSEVLYRMPSSIFLCYSLKSISLCHCTLSAPPTDFGGFKKLTRINFKEIHFSGSFFSYNSRVGLPSLLKLTFEKCTGMENLVSVFQAPNLRFMWVDDTPNLRWMALQQCFPKVKRLGIIHWEAEEDHELQMNLISFLEKFPSISSLVMSSFTIEVLGNIPRIYVRPKLQFLTAIDLDLFAYDNVTQIEAVCVLLISCPHLTVLRIWKSDRRINLGTEVIQDDDRIGDTSLISIRSAYTGFNNELSFLKFVTAHSPGLKSLIIDVMEKLSTEDRIKILNKLNLSPNIKVIFCKF